MLEEKNDNLSRNENEADGNLAHDSAESNQSETEVLETKSVAEPIDVPAEDNVVIPSTEELQKTDAASETDNQTALNAIADTNAEESEDETLKERHDIPMQDYDTLSLESLVDELKNLVSNEKVMSAKDHIEEIKKSFLAKYNHLLEEKKEEFLAENQDPNEEFQYHSPLKTNFDKYYSIFRDAKNTHFKSLQTNLKTNLENRLAIVEELKELINPQENIKDTLKHFNDLRERWKNA
ncbi:MAG TPA: DUF349 domain-containing protein, partial [Flavobacterium sp.]